MVRFLVSTARIISVTRGADYRICVRICTYFFRVG